MPLPMLGILPRIQVPGTETLGELLLRPEKEMAKAREKVGVMRHHGARVVRVTPAKATLAKVAKGTMEKAKVRGGESFVECAKKGVWTGTIHFQSAPDSMVNETTPTRGVSGTREHPL